MISAKKAEAQKRNARRAGEVAKQSAIDRYYKSPNICKYCGKIMTLKENQEPHEVKIKKFCSRHCSGKGADKFPRINASKFCCVDCGAKIRNRKTQRCVKCRRVFLHEQAGVLTKGKALRTRISEHARRVLRDDLSCCFVCGYSFAVEAAHIKSVKSFPLDALVKDINDRNNLIALCPNHHLEFDRGKLSLQQIFDSRVRAAA